MMVSKQEVIDRMFSTLRFKM